MGTAELIWKSCVLLVIVMFVIAGILDVILFYCGLETISQWLRHHPAWYWVPAFALSLFLAWLAFHLFLER